ncbi:RelA/SpoT domain-containing protein [Agrobacterium sp. O3.4]|uniref:RelA/SpoT domain-containing protein n=1 Tax=Agrobacterium cucumeris TaxID=2862866 RepID=A0ABY8RW87_9HYPH|nr:MULTISPECIES: RelA/SpoT domain-containing protein [Rhizobium/Agrobacterium group]MCZ7470271.1 RelA/SpoT domain-containing protein [Rhizobium rhizogenes]WHO11533.1 RelA/SpoT domain-containing protein [Agrobacterium cucumeris]
MTKEEELLERWDAEQVVYAAWGRMISNQVSTALGPIIAPIRPDYFLRTPVVPRTKDGQKLVEKAFYRNKNYANPYKDITDKVGTRFVVLLGSEIPIVEKALTSIKGWYFSKDRDYEEEQKKNPLQFDYAAVHYVVRPEANVEFEGVQIPADTPCEVQIKTILQHAYSELTHDTIYKPQIEATPMMQRNAAKAMALLEATNDYFEKVAEDVNNVLTSVRHMTADLSSLYRTAVGIDPKPTVLEGLLLSAYEDTAGDGYVAQIEEMLAEQPFIAECIKTHIGQRNPLFSQPSVLLVYLSVARSPNRAKSQWPLTPAEMEPLLNDLGESIH